MDASGGALDFVHCALEFGPVSLIPFDEIVGCGDHTILEPGGVFGEISFFDAAPHSASVRAMSEVEVMRLTREKYDLLCEIGMGAACKIAVSTIGVVAERLRRMDAWVRDLVEQPEVAVHHKEEWKEFRAKLYADWQF